MSILREEYNTLLKRWKKAFTYLSSDISEADQQKWLPEYEKIGNRLNVILNELKMQGVTPTNERIMEGL